MHESHQMCSLKSSRTALHYKKCPWESLVACFKLSVVKSMAGQMNSCTHPAFIRRL